MQLQQLLDKFVECARYELVIETFENCKIVECSEHHHDDRQLDS